MPRQAASPYRTGMGVLARLVLAVFVVAAGLGSVVAPATSGAGDAGPPPEFSDTVVHTVADPTALAFTPDGRMLITQRTGKLRVVRDGVLLAQPALNLSGRICSGGERGLLGVAVDPNFAANHFVYLFWTHDAFDFCGVGGPNAPENRVTRHVLRANDTVEPGSQRVLVDHIASKRENHNAGDLQFGFGELLYVSVGDGGCTLGQPNQCGADNTNSRRLDIPQGKILRVTRTGKVPASNPYVGAPGARRCTQPSGPDPGTGPCTETFASGFRNPFRFARQPGTRTFYVNDVGQSTWEEIDRLERGADYGWNVREGHCATDSTTDCGPTSFENPLHDYSHAATDCQSITGGAFVPEGLWPAPYDGAYLFADFVCGTVFRLAPAGGGAYTQEPFITDVAGPVHLAFGPYEDTQALYYLAYFDATVHRVVLDETR